MKQALAPHCRPRMCSGSAPRKRQTPVVNMCFNLCASENHCAMLWEETLPLDLKQLIVVGSMRALFGIA